MFSRKPSAVEAISPILSREWFVFRYGAPVLIPQSVEKLNAEGKHFAWRNELHELYHLTGRCPWTVLAEMTKQMNGQGVNVSGVVSDLASDSYSAQLNLALQHQEQLKLPARWFSQFCFDGRELTQPDAEAKGRINCYDEIEGFKVVREKRTFYSWVHQKEISLDYRIVAESVDLHQGQSDDVTILNARDESLGDETSPVRKLPWPFRNFLAINSDIDWTTEDQLREFHELTQDNPWGGSAYFSSQSPHWISLKGQGEVVKDCGNCIDTLHTWSETIETLEFESPISESEWKANGHGCYGALVVWLTAPASGLVAKIDGVEKEWSAIYHSPVAAKNEKYAVVFSWGEVLEFSTREFALQFEGLDSGVAVEQCFLCSLDPVEIRRWVEENQGNVQTPIFSFHGGGENVREIAALRTGLVKEREPDTMACDLDDPGSPFYLVPELKKLGVRFLNPRGSFICRDLVPVDQLLNDITLEDGSSFLAFRRFLTKREEELGLPSRWNGGKSASHPEALEFIVTDLLQRMAHADAGTGAIIYTHLGHSMGNQLNSELDWPFHFRSWLSLLIRLSVKDQKLWMASASEILKFALVRSELNNPGALEIAQGRVEIMFEGAVTDLSGQTIFVENPGAMSVLVNEAPIPADSIQINESSGAEPSSITFL